MRERRWVYLLGLTVLLGVAWPGGHRLPADRAVELLLLLLVAYAVLRREPVRRVLAGLPARLRVVGVTLCVAIYLGHVFGQSGRALPFVPWTMYTTHPASRPVRTFEFTGITASGEAVSILPTARSPRLHTEIVPFGLFVQAEEAMRQVEDGRPPYALARLRGNLLALARAHEREIARVEVTRVALPPGTFTRRAARRDVVWVFEVP